MVPVVIVVAAAVASDGTWPMSTCEAKGQLDNTCIAGDAYNRTQAGTAAECCSLCAADAPPAGPCRSWTFNNSARHKSCHLHPDPITKTEPGSCTSGPPISPTPAPAPVPPAPSSARNLLYVVVDDLRNELSFTDARKGLITPRADALAQKGMAFSRAYVQQGVCSPSRNSFMSGRRPDTTRVWNFKGSFRDALGDNISSWPGAFKNAGYVTVGLGKVYHPHHPPNDDGALSWSLDAFPYFHPSGYASKISNASDATFQDGMTTAVALQRLRSLANVTTPFFLAVGIHKPHLPWVMPQRFLDMQTAQDAIDTAAHDTPPEGYCNVSLWRCPSQDAPLPWEPLDKSLQQAKRRLYRAAVSWTDHNLGLLLDELAALQLAASTAIFLHGDHGWQLGEHGLWCKQSNFDLVARVPLVVYVPWLPQSHGQQSAALVEIVDLMPTTLALMGLESRVPDFAQLEGASFLPLLEKPGTPATSWKNATFTQYPRCNDTSTGAALFPWQYPTNDACTGDNSAQFEAMGYSIRSDSWRYTLWLKWDGGSESADWDSVVGEELYDHAGDDGMDTDAFENANLAADGKHASVMAQLRAALRLGWRRALPPKW